MQQGRDYTYFYKPDESPPERLRNKLSGILTLLSIFKGKTRPKNLDQLIKNSEKDTEDILKIINDIESDYNLFI